MSHYINNLVLTRALSWFDTGKMRACSNDHVVLSFDTFYKYAKYNCLCLYTNILAIHWLKYIVHVINLFGVAVINVRLCKLITVNYLHS